MTRTCCCCIPVLGGATLIGILGVLLSLAYMAPLVAYQADLDTETQWNPIKENIKHIEWGIERSIEASTVPIGYSDWPPSRGFRSL